MALTAAAFKDRHPEFASVEDALVSAALADALAEIDTAVWGSNADRGQGLLAAHELAMSPAGAQAGLQIEDEDGGKTSRYWSRYASLRDRIGCAHGVQLE